MWLALHMPGYRAMKPEEILSVFGSSLPDISWSNRIADAICDAVIEAVETAYRHPDYPDEAARLANSVLQAVEAGERLPYPVEGWEYWFGDGAAFRAYERARDMGLI